MIDRIRRRFKGQLLWLKEPVFKAYRKLVRANYQFVDWQAVLTRDRAMWEEARRASQAGPHVLIGTTLKATANV